MGTQQKNQLCPSFKLANKTPKNNKINPATKTFQAIRIAVNNELEEIKTALNASLKLLVPKGRILAVSFHSLEDRIVKKFFHENSNLKENSNRHLPPSFNRSPKLKIISKKPILPTETELNHNIRSRSAKLRYVIKRRNFYNFKTDIFEKFKKLIEIENLGKKL